MTFRFGDVLFLALALALVLVVNGAVPGVLLPTLGQAVWTAGFGQSFVNESIFNIYAHNIGAPAPAAIAFGLAGAWPTGLLIGAGLHPADAYSAVNALWLTVAFFGALGVAKRLGCGSVTAILAATAWLVAPIVVEHQGYSMVALGVALVPTYLFAALELTAPDAAGSGRRIGIAAMFVAACFVAAFMDGYTFVMFAVGAALILLLRYIFEGDQRRRLLRYAIPVYVAGFGLAYAAYALYVGTGDFGGFSMDFFRGWGADLTFFAAPTAGRLWLPDAFGLSIPRTSTQWFGDASVWLTTFCLPLVIGGLFGLVLARGRRGLALAFLAVALFGFYMALGPSLKINSMSPPGAHDQLMPAEYAVAPTGSSAISSWVPGFKTMRASYRWTALGMAGAWMLLLLGLGRSGPRLRTAGGAVLLAVIALYVPHLDSKIVRDAKSRRAFYAIDADLVKPMATQLRAGEHVAFLPPGNDFLVNYLASRLKIVAFNMGGDKNVAAARRHWPPLMQEFPPTQIDADFAPRLLMLLASRAADAIVLSYVDLLWAAHAWPAPTGYKSALDPVIEELLSSGLATVETGEYYAVVRLSAAAQAAPDLDQRVVRHWYSSLRRNGFEAADINSQVGRLEAGQMVSDGRRGFLLYGPYVGLAEGRYELKVFGAASSASADAFVDVASGHGSIIHGRFSIGNAGQGKDVVAGGKVILDNRVTDLEIRVFVAADDVVSVSGYELVGAAPPNSTPTRLLGDETDNPERPIGGPD